MANDYIRREDAVDAVKHAWAKGIEPSQYIESLEPADVAPVVRCKDCKHLGITTLGSYWCRNVNGCAKPTPDGFCGYGERREE